MALDRRALLLSAGAMAMWAGEPVSAAPADPSMVEKVKQGVVKLNRGGDSVFACCVCACVCRAHARARAADSRMHPFDVISTFVIESNPIRHAGSLGPSPIADLIVGVIDDGSIEAKVIIRLFRNSVASLLR